MREVGVQLLQAGHCRHPEAMTLRGASWKSAVFPALPALLMHPVEGPILFDTGYGAGFIEATRPFPERFYRWLTPMQLAPGQDVASHCRARGIDPADVQHVVLSHFHADHIAGLENFPAARIHCAGAGLTLASSAGRWRSVCRGVLRSLLPADVATRAEFFEEARSVSLPAAMKPFTRGADVLGDGSLLAVELPGHCPGHWGLLVADAARGLHFLVADAAWSLQAIRGNRPPPALTTGFLGKTRAARETLGALQALQLRNKDIIITPYHCAESALAAEKTREQS